MNFFESPGREWYKFFEEDQRSLVLSPRIGGAGRVTLLYRVVEGSPAVILTQAALHQIRERTQKPDDLLGGLSVSLLSFVVTESIAGEAADRILQDVWWSNFVVARHDHFGRRDFRRYFTNTDAWYLRALEQLEQDPDLEFGPNRSTSWPEQRG